MHFPWRNSTEPLHLRPLEDSCPSRLRIGCVLAAADDVDEVVGGRQHGECSVAGVAHVGRAPPRVQARIVHVDPQVHIVCARVNTSVSHLH